jgi:hypothetical protein
MKCYRTVADENDPSNVVEMEQAHVCEERYIRRMQTPHPDLKGSIASPSQLTEDILQAQKKADRLAGQPITFALSAV